MKSFQNQTRLLVAASLIFWAPLCSHATAAEDRIPEQFRLPIGDECPYTGFMHGAPPAMPDWPVGSYELRGKSIIDVFGMEAEPWGPFLNTGMVWPLSQRFPEEVPVKELSVSLSSTTVGGVFDALTEADGRYSWRQEGIVFNVLPKPANKTRLAADVLERRLSRFDVDDVDIWEAGIRLVLAARKEGLSSVLGFSVPDDVMARGPMRKYVKYERFSLHLKNPTLRECLNAIVSADPPSAWTVIVTRTGIDIVVRPTHEHLPENYPNLPPPGPFGRKLTDLRQLIEGEEIRFRNAKKDPWTPSGWERASYLKSKEMNLEAYRAHYRKLVEANERCLKKRRLK